MELLDLIDDVLLNVCEYLDVFELVAVAGTCRRLAALAASVASRRYRCLDYERFMHEHSDFRVPRCGSDFATTMRFIGPHVQRMYFDGNCVARILHFVRSCCGSRLQFARIDRMLVCLVQIILPHVCEETSKFKFVRSSRY